MIDQIVIARIHDITHIRLMRDLRIISALYLTITNALSNGI